MYYKENTLEHYRYKNIFLRRTKKAFISFVSKNLIDIIAKESRLTKNILSKRLYRRDINRRFKALRRYNASFLTRYLRQSEIDFLQGRVSTSVFMKNYFNPALISDLKFRTIKASNEILNELR